MFKRRKKKVEPVGTPNYQMYSEEGNAAVHEMVQFVELAIRAGAKETSALDTINTCLTDIYKVHPEILTVAVRDAAFAILDPIWEKAFGHRIQ